MQSLTRAPRRRVAAGVAVAGLAAATFGVLPAAQAAPPSASYLDWNISEQFVSHLSTRTLAGGASFDEASQKFRFPASTITVEADGDVVRSYSGTVRGAFANPATRSELYAVTLTDPRLTVEPDGEGRIEATVSASNAAFGGPAAATDPTFVTVAEFAGATTSQNTTTVIPKYAGVLPAGSDAAVELGLSASQPVGGESFHPEFLGALTPGVRAHFYNSGTGSSNPKKPVGTLVATTVPSVTTTVTGASVTHGLDVKVEGTGFNPTTNPGDAGVYVALAPADTVIDYANRASMAAMTAVNYVMPSDFYGDSFTTVLNAPTEKLVPGKEYAVFTWQAHTHSNTTQDTRTPVAIDWSVFAPAPAPTPAPVPTPAPALQVKPKVKAKVAKAPSTKKAGKAVVTLTGKAGTVTGKVNATLKSPGKKKAVKVTAKLNKKGKATIKLPKGKRGAYKLVVRFTGDDSYTKARKVVKYRIAR
ncbi:HtaA domain-containing protein [Nocardioides campestrisoli]|uniref:HtaA domain-containing protein n=1 Tax=Nocardioides campestrisoli TaxID=2736757 RepID=UPI0015E7AE59|nr:HtaA domain-containing protein [Nocardioides campestrisoli]